MFSFALFVVCFVHAAYYLWIEVDHPAVDLYSFRQTQTALSAVWMAKQGFRLSYETPASAILVDPPFEFPIYQNVVLLSRARLSIDVAGRIVNFLFYIGTLYPLWILSMRSSSSNRLG